MSEVLRDSIRSSVSSPGSPNMYWTPSFSRHFTKRSDAFIGSFFYHHGLDIDELLQPVVRQFSADPGFLYPSKGEPRVGLHHVVYGNASRVDPPGEPFGPSQVPAPDRSAETVCRIIRRAYGRIFIFYCDHRGHRAEYFFCEDLHIP